MPWLLFVLAAGAIWMAFSTFSIGLAAVCLILALGFIVAGALMLASAKISGLSQSPSRMMDSEALAVVRRRAASAPGPEEDESGVSAGHDTAESASTDATEPPTQTVVARTQ